MAYLMKKRGSKSGVLENIVGFEKISSPTDSFEGVELFDNSIRIHFIKEMPKLLEAVSFGLYSIVPPSAYDSVSGEWKSNQINSASGPYEIKKWDESSLELRLRQNYPSELVSKRPFEEIVLNWSPEVRTKADVFFGEDLETPHDAQFEFFGSAKANIAYIRCFSWTLPSSPLYGVENRRILRSAVYHQMERRGSGPIRSFFPLVIPGVHAFKDSPEAVTLVDLKDTPIRFAKRSGWSTFFKNLDDSIVQATKELNLTTETINLSSSELRAEREPGKSIYRVDLARFATGILIDDPKQDVKFMFESKEGIRLPDPSGRVKKILENENFSIQEVNEQIWNDAVIWPVTHLAYGLWVNMNKVETTFLNSAQPPTDLSLLSKRQ